jgi:hypothetical protein
MLVASLGRKLRPDQEQMEDVLTSQVLGACRYLPAAAGWAPLLAAARTLDGAPLPMPRPEDPVVSRFWPRWRHPDGRQTEPDVVVRWPGALLVIEAKYRSGKSSKADPSRPEVTDQLGRQLVLARDHAAAEGRAFGVLYLTADVLRPTRALLESLAEVRQKRGWAPRVHLAWASWTDLRAGLSAFEGGPPGTMRLCSDAVRYLDQLGFGGFGGVKARVPAPAPWRFAHAPRFLVPPQPAPWRFGAAHDP